MWKILVPTESSSEKGAKRWKQIYCISGGSGDIQEKRKVEKQGVCVFLLFTVYIVHVVYKTDTCSLDNDFVSSDGNLEVSVFSRRSAYICSLTEDKTRHE